MNDYYNKIGVPTIAIKVGLLYCVYKCYLFDKNTITYKLLVLISTK